MTPTGFSVGDATIDAQHKELFHLIDEVLEEDITEEKLEKNIAFLGEYVDCHLSHEEAYMKAHGYPHLEEHLEWHKKFKEKYTEFKDACRKNNSIEDLHEEMKLYVRNWWYKHILIEDQRYAQYISSNKASHPDNEDAIYHDTDQKSC